MTYYILHFITISEYIFKSSLFYILNRIYSLDIAYLCNHIYEIIVNIFNIAICLSVNEYSNEMFLIVY